MKQTGRMFRSVTALLTVLLLLCTLMPVSVFAAATVGENYDALVRYIEENGMTDEELGWKYLEDYYEVENFTVLFGLLKNDDGLTFVASMIGDETMPLIVDNRFLLQKSSKNISVEFGAMLLLSETDYDMVESTKTIDKTKVTTTPNYTVRESSKYITAEQATSLFNATFQMLCQYWDEYLGENLNFGLQGLGFTAYEGFMPLPCIHTFDNDCDPDCNECDFVRETSHSFGPWQQGDEKNHTCQCAVCGETKKEAHSWGGGVLTGDIITYTCGVCGAERTLNTSDVIPGDLNGDFMVTNLDVEYLLWYTLYPEDYPLSGDGDYNQDGAVNNLDVEYLLWHTLYPEDYPL